MNRDKNNLVEFNHLVPGLPLYDRLGNGLAGAIGRLLGELVDFCDRIARQKF